MRWLLGLFLLMMFSHQPLFAALSSWVQGDVFVQGEAFELIVEAEEDGDLQIPEMDGLKILSRSTQSQTSIINGSISKAHRWIFTILPNQAGVLRIPPFQLGNEQTEEIQLEIADRKSHQMALPPLWFPPQLADTAPGLPPSTGWPTCSVEARSAVLADLAPCDNPRALRGAFISIM